MARRIKHVLVEAFDAFAVRPISYWQLILLQSQANGCFYHGDDLPYNLWAWPRNTWFQERLSRHLKVLEIAADTANEMSGERASRAVS